MFALSDSRRRLICRLLFLGFGILPMALTGYFIMHPTTPADWKLAIQANTGLALKCERVETPIPSRVILKNVTFEDPALHGIGSIPEIQIHFDEIVRVRIAGSLQMDTRALGHLLQALQTGVVANQRVDTIWHLQVEKMLLVSEADPARSLILRPLEFSLSPLSGQTSLAKLKFQVAEEPTRSQIELAIEREHGVRLTPRRLIASTGQAWLPVWLLQETSGVIPPMGPTADFTGGAELTCQVDRWAGSLQGELRSVDLEQLTQDFPATLAGNAQILFHCQMQTNKIHRLDCEVLARHGQLHPVWSDVFLKDPGAQPTVSEPDDAFQILHANFVVTQNRIFFCESEQGQGQWATDRLGQPWFNLAGRFSLPLQDTVQQLTLGGLPSDAVADSNAWQRDLNDAGVEILRMFQLSPEIQTASPSSPQLR